MSSTSHRHLSSSSPAPQRDPPASSGTANLAANAAAAATASSSSSSVSILPLPRSSDWNMSVGISPVLSSHRQQAPALPLTPLDVIKLWVSFQGLKARVSCQPDDLVDDLKALAVQKFALPTASPFVQILQHGTRAPLPPETRLTALLEANSAETPLVIHLPLIASSDGVATDSSMSGSSVSDSPAAASAPAPAQNQVLARAAAAAAAVAKLTNRLYLPVHGMQVSLTPQQQPQFQQEMAYSPHASLFGTSPLQASSVPPQQVASGMLMPVPPLAPSPDGSSEGDVLHSVSLRKRPRPQRNGDSSDSSSSDDDEARVPRPRLSGKRRRPAPPEPEEQAVARYPDGSIMLTASGKPRVRIPACGHCRRAKTKCEGGIPCRRCIRLNRADTCERCEPKGGRRRSQPDESAAAAAMDALHNGH